MHRSVHVLWCHCCRRVSAFKRQSRNGRGKIPALLAPAEVVPYATEVVFCGRCPRKLCKECYVNGVGADEDRSTWVSLCCPGRGSMGWDPVPTGAALCRIRTTVTCRVKLRTSVDLMRSS